MFYKYRPVSAAYLVDAVVPVALLGGVLADAPALGAPHHAHRLPLSPVPRLGAVFVIERRVAVQCQRPVGGGGSTTAR